MKKEVLNNAIEGISNALTVTEKENAKNSLLTCKQFEIEKKKKGYRYMTKKIGENKTQKNLVCPEKFDEKIKEGWSF